MSKLRRRVEAIGECPNSGRAEQICNSGIGATAKVIQGITNKILKYINLISSRRLARFLHCTTQVPRGTKSAANKAHCEGRRAVSMPLSPASVARRFHVQVRLLLSRPNAGCLRRRNIGRELCRRRHQVRFRPSSRSIRSHGSRIQTSHCEASRQETNTSPAMVTVPERIGEQAEGRCGLATTWILEMVAGNRRSPVVKDPQ